MFEIDLGHRPRHSADGMTRVDRCEIIMDAVLDALPPDATQSQIDSMVMQVVTGELRSPKKLETVRRRLLQLWPLVAPLAEREPEQFDAILSEFAEIASTIG